VRRSLVTLVTLVGVFTSASVFARKKIVIMEPPLVRACPRVKSWQDLTGCLTKHGWGARVERTIGKAKLLRLDVQNGSTRIDNMLALYIEDAKGVHLGGMYAIAADDASMRSFVLAAEELTVKAHTGIRIDLGEERPSSVSIDDITARSAVQLVRHSLYCSGLSWECADITTACDVLVDGKTYWTFRGNVTIKDNMILVAGNRDLAGSCTSNPSQFLGWPTSP
jgi:hypothetical protein